MGNYWRYMKDLIDVVCAVIRKGDKILVTQRGQLMSLPLKWEFPGGKIEQDEDEQVALHREIMEELNISIRIVKKLPTELKADEVFSINLIPFLAEYVDGEIILEEHHAYRFLHFSQLEELDWAAADIPVVRAVMQMDLPSSF